jgi:hypothetical protein
VGSAIVLVWSVALLCVTGWTLAGALGIGSFALRILAAYTVGWAVLVVSIAFLSVPGWLSRGSLVVVLTAAAGAAVAVRARLRRGSYPSASGTVREVLADPIVMAMAIVVVSAGTYLAALSFLTTPNDWDGLTYHETRALLWDQQGGIGHVPSGNEPRLNGNPPVAEIGLYLVMLVPRSERFAAFPQFAALWACLLAVVLIGRRLGLSCRAAAYSGLVFATLPVVMLQGAAVLNDLLVASFLLAAVVFLAGRSRAELVVGSVALGLALSTKFNAVLALPLVVIAVVAVVTRPRLGASIVACAAGVVLGMPWYVVNLIETGSFDGKLGDATGQTSDHSVRGVLGTLRALAFDVVDVSGFLGAELCLAVVVGGAMAVLGIRLTRRGAAEGRALVSGALFVALVPLALRAAEGPARYAWSEGWSKLGQEGIARDHNGAWHVLQRPDTSLSWYGAAGAVLIFGGVVAAVVGVRRRELRSGAHVLAAMPLLLIVILAFTIVYDDWRGRLVMFTVGLTCAAWGWTIRVRWLSIGMTALCATTVALSLVHSYTKPSGLGIVERADSRSVWHRDRIDTLTVIRDYDGTPELLRTVERDVSVEATLAVAAPIDTFLAPLAGRHLSRTLRLIPEGAPVPADATWLVSKNPALALGCPGTWSTVFVDKDNGWRLLRRMAPDACGSSSAPL